jgi:predicted Ser/Thr protein kinase
MNNSERYTQNKNLIRILSQIEPQLEYKILKIISTGAFATVYEVFRKNENLRSFALKIQNDNPEASLEESLIKKIQEKGWAGFPKLIATGLCEDQHYILMQHLGAPLLQTIPDGT